MGLRTRALTTSAGVLTGACATVLVTVTSRTAFAVRSGMTSLPGGLATFADTTFAYAAIENTTFANTIGNTAFANTTMKNTTFANTSGRPFRYATATTT